MDGIDISILRGVRQVPGLNERFWRFVKVEGECWVWYGTRYKPGRFSRGGYGTFALPVRSERGNAIRTEPTHRIVYEAVNGPPERDQLILHSCDNPPCIRPLHLRAGSGTDNSRDKFARGRGNNPRKLSDEQVKALRETYAADPSISAATLGRQYGVTTGATVGMIRGFLRRYAGGPRSVIRRQKRKPHTTKLTEEQVQEMRTRHAASEMTMSQLAKHYGIEVSGVSRIVRGELWSHASGPLKPPKKYRRLEATEVSTIRQRIQEGTSQRHLAKEYGVSPVTVYRITRGLTHRLTPPTPHPR